MDEICQICRKESGAKTNALGRWFLPDKVASCSAVSKWSGRERFILTDGSFFNGGISYCL